MLLNERRHTEELGKYEENICSEMKAARDEAERNEAADLEKTLGVFRKTYREATTFRTNAL